MQFTCVHKNVQQSSSEGIKKKKRRRVEWADKEIEGLREGEETRRGKEPEGFILGVNVSTNCSWHVLKWYKSKGGLRKRN